MDVNRNPSADVGTRAERDTAQVMIEDPWACAALRALTGALRRESLHQAIRRGNPVLKRQMDVLNRCLIKADAGYRAASRSTLETARAAPCRLTQRWSAAWAEGKVRLELMNPSKGREAPMQDFPWPGVHYVVTGKIQLRSFRRLHLVARPGLYELKLVGEHHLDTGDSVEFTPLGPDIHEFAPVTPQALVLTVALARDDRERYRYHALGDLGCFDDMVLADAAPREGAPVRPVAPRPTTVTGAGEAVAALD